MSLAASPVREPDERNQPLMTRRAWWLVGLNLLIPGSAQLLAGSRRLGRFGVSATFLLWVLALIALVLWLFWRTAALTIAGSAAGLWLIAAVLVFYAALWLVLTLDTLRLVRLVKAAPGARPLLAGVAILALFAVSGTAAFGAWVAANTSGFVSDVFTAGEAEPPVDGRYNFLLLGGDAGTGREGLRPDSITVASVDAVTGEAVLIGLPRNLELVPFAEDSPMAQRYPGGYGATGCAVDVCLLNSIYTEVELFAPELYPEAIAAGSSPGLEATRDAVEGITGLSIHYLVTIDMAGFAALIDALGGVTLNVTERVPIHADESFTTVAEWIEPGVQTMDGYHALWFARSRHDTTDYDRMLRQRQLQQAIIEQFTPANILSRVQGVAAAGAEVIGTDVPQSMLGVLIELAVKTRELPIGSLELTPDNDVDPAFPDFPYIRELVAEATAVAETEP